jgi:hypothetical protein
LFTQFVFRGTTGDDNSFCSSILSVCSNDSVCMASHLNIDDREIRILYVAAGAGAIEPPLRRSGNGLS